jgi:signal transduction histidine kinase
MTLEELLHQALTLVLHNAWPVTLGVGAVFLVDEGTGEIVLKAHSGVDRDIVERCARVPRGHCLCGRVASSGQALYCGGTDERHEITYVGISPHGHYCIPIAAGDTVLGVLNVYLAAGHPQDAAEEALLGSFASTLAGIIVRKRAEQSLRAADEQLREQATLVKLGEMAAVVAHEVRNPLAGVRSAIQVIGRRLPPGGKDAAVIGEITARLDALAELMKDLLLFARPPQVHQVPVDIMALAKETSALVSQDPTMRDVRFEIEGSASAVMVDPQLLQIVLLNLFLNAAHAIQSSGTIRTSVTVGDRACRISVADTGPGIPPEIRDHIFAPFFTTKSRGTGLGLSTAKRLVESHHGCISVECPPEGGTIVTIELPRGEQAQTARD